MYLPMNRHGRLFLALSCFTLAGGCTRRDETTNPPTNGTLTSITVTGDSQTAVDGTEPPNPIVITLLDDQMRPVGGQTVNLAIVEGGGSLSASSVVTTDLGEARVRWTLGTTAGACGLGARTVDPRTGAALTLAIRATAIGGAPTSILVTPRSPQIAPGARFQFAATGRDAYGNATTVKPRWSVDSGGGAIDGVSGVFTAAAVGGWFPGTVRAIQDAISGTASVAVVNAGPIRLITVSPPQGTLATADSQRFTATAQDSAGTVVDINPIWTVVDRYHCAGAVDHKTGIFVAGAGPGSCDVVATFGAGVRAAYVTVTGPVMSFTVLPTSPSPAIGDTQRFIAVGEDASHVSAKLLPPPTWSVANGGGGIDGSGLFTAGGAPGTFSVVARWGDFAVQAPGVVLPFPLVDLSGGYGVAINDADQVVINRWSGSAMLVSLWDRGTLTSIDTLGYCGVECANGAAAINRMGQVVGAHGTAVLWDHGTKTTLGNMAGYPLYLSDAGDVAGVRREWLTVSGYANPQERALLWRRGTLIDLGTLGDSNTSSVPTAVNSAGKVVGWSSLRCVPYSGCGPSHAFLWEDGVMSDLGTLAGGTSAIAYAINSAGRVVGVSSTADSCCHAFLWDHGEMTDLGPGTAYGINMLDQIVGINAGRAMVWDHGSVTDLGVSNAVKVLISDAGQVAIQTAGTSADATSYLWDRGVLTNLGSVGAIQTTVSGISRTGWIVGTGLTAYIDAVRWPPQNRAVLWKSR
jgi:probable HAF family extracellular repeat protein